MDAWQAGQEAMMKHSCLLVAYAPERYACEKQHVDAHEWAERLEHEQEVQAQNAKGDASQVVGKHREGVGQNSACV